ncbi:MAG TPA: thiamine ABC transporter substrate-binding protein [Ilumatobacter sp.]|nr:thiamine ABC transporter substrate-binding protein [Ilumatobacter sp.]
MNRLRTTLTRSGIAMLAVVAMAACGDDGSDGTPSTDSTDSPDSPDSPDCGPAATVPTGGGDAGDTVTLVAYESFPTDAENPAVAALAAFTASTGIAVDILIAGDTGTMLSKATLTAGNPEGDVMWGVDNSFLSRAISACVFEPYEAAGLADLPTEFTGLVPDHHATPVDFGDVCVNYDIAALEAAGVEPPTSFDDLLKPEYSGMLVVENPATSSPGLAFLMGTVAQFGEDAWADYWSQLADNDVLVVDGWSQAYYEAFSWAGGDRPLVVSYGSSPPFEVLYAAEPLAAAPTGVAEQTCVRQVEFAGILRGTERLGAAQQLVDFLASPEFQREVALNLFVFPVHPDVELDQAFVDYAAIPESPLSLDPAVIDARREEWIEEWTRLVPGS